MIELTVKTLDSQNHPFSVPDDTTVKQLKERVAETINVPVDVQRMIYCGRVLQDEKALSEYDVNGKVIHLVQRPPPQLNNSGTEQQQQNRFGPSPPGQHGRRTMRHSRIDGNAMYLGAMAFPADLMDAQGIQPPQPSHSLSRSRLSLAMQMLNRAKNCVAKLENPEGQESPGAQTPPEEAENGSETTSQPEGSDGVPSEAASTSTEATGGLSQAAAAAAIAAAVSAAQSVGMPSITIVRGGDQQEEAAEPPPAYEDLEISEREEVVPEGSADVRQDTLEFGVPEAGNPAQPQPQEAATDDRGRPRTSVMAGVMDELNSVHERLQPFLQQYHQLMRDDPSYDGNVGDARSAQRVFGLVSEVMHLLSHAYHAMSDVMCDFSSAAPRILRCRPVLIQHSAVLQAGIPIQAQFNLVTNRGTNTGSGHVTRDADSTTEASAAQAQQQNNAATAPAESGNNIQSADAATGENSAIPRENGSNTSPSSAAVGEGENVARSRTRGVNGSLRSRNGSRVRTTQTRTRVPRAAGGTFFSPQSFSISPADVEVFMEVGPSSITIDSMETRVLNGSGAAGGNEQQNAGANFPAPEFIQNLMQAMAGHVMGRVGTPVATTTSSSSSTTTTAAATTTTTTTTTNTTNTSSSSSSSTSSSTSAASTTGSQVQAGEGRRAGQDSQARGNTATHPTTATQTRSTSRPHVHLAPSAMHSALGTSNFDPFLPCNSHHIRSSRRRRAARLGPTVTFTTDRPPRSVGLNVGFIPIPQSEQPSQSSENPPQDSSQPSQPPPEQPTEPNLLGFLDMFGGLAANILSDANNILSEGGNTVQEAVAVDSESLPPSFQQFLRGLLDPTATESTMPDNGAGVQSLLQGMPLFQMLSGGLDGQNRSLVDLLQSFGAQPESEGEHVLTDFVMTVARGLTFQDLCVLRMGNTQPLQTLRPRVQEFVRQRVLQGDDPSTDSITRAVDRILVLMRPHFNTLLEVHVRDDVDIISTVNHFHQIRLPEVLELLTNEGESSDFGRQAVSWWKRYYRELLAVLMYCCVDKLQGLEAIVRSYVSQVTQGMSPLIQQTTLSCLLNSVRSCVSQLTIDAEDIQPYVVYRMGCTDLNPAPVFSEQERMEMDLPPEDQIMLEIREEIPDLVIGSEPWHSEVPSDWVPLISRDIPRQRRQSSQAPFSDAYLSGMPSKRRKVVTSKKPQGNLNQAITETVRGAIEAAGVGPLALREVVSQAAGSDPAIQAAYSDRLRALMQDRLITSRDYSPDRFPNTAKFFTKK